MLLNTEEAADCLRAGQLIAYPTEAVYGLGCDPRNEIAVDKLLALKSRPANSGLILIGSSFSQFDGWIARVPDHLREKAERRWPGPVTWLFPKGEDVPDYISGKHETLAIRVTAHVPCVQLCDVFGGPVVSTSANPHAAQAARSAGEVEDFFGPFLGGILAGPLGGRRQTSEIIDLETGKAIREG